MKCTGCFKEFEEEEKAYATVVGRLVKSFQHICPVKNWNLMQLVGKQ